MYKIMLADDEGIVIDSLKFIIEKNFKNKFIIKHAMTGRKLIELAEEFKPDIAFIDIHMPGINGIDAMKEIKKINNSTLFIVLTAYDKFNYAKEAINLGVLEYLTKPVNYKIIVEVIKKAMNIVDTEKSKRSNELMIKEKLEIVIPILESDFIYAILAGDELSKNIDNFINLLNIKQDYGSIMVLEFGDTLEEGVLTNPVGISISSQAYYSKIREKLKDEFECIVGPIMLNKIIVFIPSSIPHLEYDNRNYIIDKARILIRELTQNIQMEFKIGIGTIMPLAELYNSYKEAINAMQNSKGRVAHAKDHTIGCDYEDDYPIKTETALYEMIDKGSIEGTKIEANAFFDWMINNYPECKMDIKLKVLEFILFAEQKAFLSGGMTYNFRYRKDYLDTLLFIDNYEQLRIWFLDKIIQACRNVKHKKKEQELGLIEKAKIYINENFYKDISLEDVSRHVDISTYYFSKLFKEETNENFIEHLTNIRIEHAKKLLQDKELSIKQICLETGYSEPNYFSRIFKKNVGITPTEYRDKL